MIKIGWKNDGIYLFDYSNETVVSLEIEENGILITFDKKFDNDNNDIKITVGRKNKYYNEFDKFFNKMFAKYEKEKLIIDDRFCAISLEDRRVNFVSLYHGVKNGQLCNQKAICLQKNNGCIDYKFILEETNKRQVLIEVGDELGLYEIYMEFISDLQKTTNCKYEKEKDDFEFYINNKLSYYNNEIKNNYDLINAFVFSLYYRELEENPFKEELRSSLDLIKHLIAENQKLNIERQKLYDQMLNSERKSPILDSNDDVDKIKKKQKEH